MTVTYDASRVTLVDHPLVQHKLSILRDKSTGTNQFRQLVRELALFDGYEAMRDLPMEDVEVETPITTATFKQLAGKKLAIVPILRAGLGMVDGILDLVPSARVGHIGMERDEVTHEPHEYYCKMPRDIDQRICLVVDPMLATGGSAEMAIGYLRERGVKDIRMLCIVAAPEGLKSLTEKDPDVHIYTCAIDDHLNEAAYIVADYMGGGSIDNFVAMMNDEAKAVGCTGTTFVDPCGLNPNNITTARDAYLILRALTAYDVFATVIATPSYDMGTNDRYTTPGTYIIQNTDKLVTNSSYHRDYTRGGKTGSLGEWQNFAGWHSQNGESYISVLLNVPYDADPEGMRPALAETGTIMDWVFDTYTIAPALDTTQPITEVRVAYSTQTDTVMLYPADNMMTLLPAAGGAALTEPVFNVPDELAAPIRQGDVVGTVTLTIQGEVIGTADLIAGSDVSRNQVLYTLSRVSLFFSSTYFKVVIALTIFVVGCYGIYIAGRVLLASRKTR